MCIHVWRNQNRRPSRLLRIAAGKKQCVGMCGEKQWWDQVKTLKLSPPVSHWALGRQRCPVSVIAWSILNTFRFWSESSVSQPSFVLITYSRCINCQIDSVDMQEKRDNIRENHTIHRARCRKLSSLAMQCWPGISNWAWSFLIWKFVCNQQSVCAELDG